MTVHIILSCYRYKQNPSIVYWSILMGNSFIFVPLLYVYYRLVFAVQYFCIIFCQSNTVIKISLIKLHTEEKDCASSLVYNKGARRSVCGVGGCSGCGGPDLRRVKGTSGSSLTFPSSPSLPTPGTLAKNLLHAPRSPLPLPLTPLTQLPLPLSPPPLA